MSVFACSMLHLFLLKFYMQYLRDRSSSPTMNNFVQATHQTQSLGFTEDRQECTTAVASMPCLQDTDATIPELVVN